MAEATLKIEMLAEANWEALYLF